MTKTPPSVGWSSVSKSIGRSTLRPYWTLRSFPARGDASISSLFDAAKVFTVQRAIGREPVVLYLGDYDQTGIDIPKVMVRSLEHDHDCPITLKRVAIERWQIEEWDLPTHPPKDQKRGDKIDVACEIDVLPPAKIRELLEQQIDLLVDRDELERLRAIEKTEQEALISISESAAFKRSIYRIWEGERNG